MAARSEYGHVLALEMAQLSDFALGLESGRFNASADDIKFVSDGISVTRPAAFNRETSRRISSELGVLEL